MTVKEMRPAVATRRAFSPTSGKRAVQQIADVTLVENSSAGHRSRTLAAQTVEVRHEIAPYPTLYDPAISHIGNDHTLILSTSSKLSSSHRRS
jgi:hypothetical protein